jgi:hypothetical protein
VVFFPFPLPQLRGLPDTVEVADAAFESLLFLSKPSLASTFETVGSGSESGAGPFGPEV